MELTLLARDALKMIEKFEKNYENYEKDRLQDPDYEKKWSKEEIKLFEKRRLVTNA